MVDHRLVLKSATGRMAERIITSVNTKMIVTDETETHESDAASCTRTDTGSTARTVIPVTSHLDPP